MNDTIRKEDIRLENASGSVSRSHVLTSSVDGEGKRRSSSRREVLISEKRGV